MSIALYCAPPAVHWVLQLAGNADKTKTVHQKLSAITNKDPFSSIHMRRRTEIWIETERAFVQTQSLIQKQWCGLCVAPSVMLTLDEAASFRCTDAPSIYSLIYSGAVHFTKNERDGLMICVHTLWRTRTIEAGS